MQMTSFWHLHIFNNCYYIKFFSSFYIFFTSFHIFCYWHLSSILTSFHIYCVFWQRQRDREDRDRDKETKTERQRLRTGDTEKQRENKIYQYLSSIELFCMIIMHLYKKIKEMKFRIYQNSLEVENKKDKRRIFLTYLWHIFTSFDNNLIINLIINLINLIIINN